MRPGRVVIGTLGLDQHEVGAIAISRFLTRQGFEVIYLGRFNTPRRLAAVAAQEDADIVGVSVHSWEFTAYADELVGLCRDLGVGLVFGGSVLTEGDRVDLLRRGVDAVFGAYASEQDMLTQIGAVIQRVRQGGPAPSVAVRKSVGPLAGRVVMVTGAAHGLGRAYTIELCRQGAAVVANDIDEPHLRKLAHEVEHTPGSIEPVPLDITDPVAPRVLLDTALSRYGQLHALISNAGVLRSGPILKLDDEDLRVLLDVHLTATFRLLRVMGGYWRAEAKSGRTVDASVVLTTSSAGLYGFRAEAGYSAAKAAVAALTTVAADELGRYGATVNALAPAARTRLTPWLGAPGSDPVSDPLAPDHVAPVVAWLVGPKAREVTGRVLEVGNGRISVPHGWQPGASFPLHPLTTPDSVAELMPQVLASTPQPRPLLTATMEDGPA